MTSPPPPEPGPGLNLTALAPTRPIFWTLLRFAGRVNEGNPAQLIPSQAYGPVRCRFWSEDHGGVRGRIRMVRHLEKSFIIPFFTLVREKWSRGCLPRGPAGWVRQPVIEAHHHSTWQSSIPRVGPTIAPPTWTTEGMRAGPKNKLQPSTY